MFKRYKVTCENCGKEDHIKVAEGNQVFFENHSFLSARYRPAGEWGFECTCGQDSRLAYEEKDNVDFLVQGSSPQVIERIKEALQAGNEKYFKMVEA
ncbi:hypothetical protein UFOVP585_47 [uncultured Caudovirales phage]|uniref:Uncharacterized protein n=1 Tax=uncultured Caudovirales phage TaxID=2100421 RepID=A0A6J5N3Y7_9CAUD|nr:hypothetical protein UFOVP585_47 [uncultured Caudovirales phage]